MADETPRKDRPVLFFALLIGGLVIAAVTGKATHPEGPRNERPPSEMAKRGDEAFAKLFGLETCNEQVRQAPQGTYYAGRLIKTRVCTTPRGTMRGESWVESSAGWVKIFDELH
jgi:hypothetical protein